MGAFSWLRAERNDTTKNIAVGDIYKILIPQEFGGGFIRDEELDWLELNYKFSAAIQVTQNFSRRRTII